MIEWNSSAVREAGYDDIMLEFAYPWVFWLLVAPAFVWLLMPVHREEVSAVRLPFFGMIAEILGMEAGEGAVVRRRTALQWLFSALAWILLVTALAKPEWVGEPIERVEASRDVMLAVDLSGSMDEHDFRRSDGSHVQRLEAVKGVVGQFISEREGDRIGLIVFGTKAYVQVPFTQDLEMARALLEASEVNMAGPNTAIGDAIGLAIRSFEASDVEKRLLVLLTDGSDTGSRMTPRNAAEVARRHGVTIYTIGVGDASAGGDDQVDFETLKTISAIGGGQFFEAGDVRALAAVYSEIDRLVPREANFESYRPRHSLVHWPAASLALLALFFYALMAIRDLARSPA
jgi:Ca-activated chloride channel family protein